MKKLLTLFLILSLSSFVTAQEVVDWSASSRMNSTGQYELVFTARIQEGWHIYSQHLKGDDGPVPTAFTIHQSKNFEKVGEVKEPEPKVEMDKAFEMEVAFFEDEVRFVQTIKPLCEKPGNVKASVEFMVCNNEMCLPPKTIDFDIPLQ